MRKRDMEHVVRELEKGALYPLTSNEHCPECGVENYGPGGWAVRAEMIELTDLDTAGDGHALITQRYRDEIVVEFRMPISYNAKLAANAKGQGKEGV